MPSEQSHREQAEYNEEAAHNIRDTAPDWAVTMCFYAALHWVECYAKVQGDDLEQKYQGCLSPHDRLLSYVRYISVTRRDRDLEKAYKNLRNESQTARYLTGIRTSSRVNYSRQNKTGVNQSFDNLRIVKQRLNS